MNDQKRTLYLHIGIHKTGTSAIQRFLELNKSRLYENGYIYRVPKLYDYDRSTRIKNSNGEEVVIESHRIYPKLRNGVFLHGNSGDSDEVNLKRLRKGLAVVGKWFEEKPNVILTDEGVSREWSRWNFLEITKEYSQKKGVDIKIIVFLRKQDDFLDSYYRQEVKGHFPTESWDSFLSGSANSDVIPTNFEKMLSFFSDIFGKENITVIPYEPGLWAKNGESIYSVFLNAIGIKDQKPYEIPRGAANESTNYSQTEIMRIINRLVEADKPLKFKTKSFFKNASVTVSDLSKEGRDLSYFSEEERRQLMAEYEEENRRIAREYLDRDRLFMSESSSKRKWEYDPAAMQEEMILYFGYVTKQLHEEIQDLKENSLSLYAIRSKLYHLKKKILNFLYR